MHQLWGPGPWTAEPDKVQWADAGTGLPCLARRAFYGHWCGYVGLPPGHPLYGLDRDACAVRPDPCARRDCAHCPAALLDVHGGLTYSGACEPLEDEALSLCHRPSPGEPDQVWWLGWDCAHADDYSPGLAALCRASGMEPTMMGTYRTLCYVQTECAQLARQLDARAWQVHLAAMRPERPREAPGTGDAVVPPGRASAPEGLPPLTAPVSLPDVLSLDPAQLSSVVLQRLVTDLQQEQAAAPRAYDRGHNRHNRGR